MNVLHINLSDGMIGASIAAYRLHSALRRAGHESRMLVWRKFSSDPHVQVIEDQRFWRFLNRAIGVCLDELSLQYVLYPSSFRLLRHPWVLEADVINLHIIHGGYFSFTVLPWLSRRVPVVVTLHDMWLMTGHCAVAAYVECQRWKTGCGECPQLNDYPGIRRDMTSLLWRVKGLVYCNAHLRLICPSKWMAEQVHNSPLLSRFKFYHVPNGIDLQVFRPVPKTDARSALGVNPEAPVLMFSADSLTKPRKGGEDLSAALAIVANHLAIRPILLLAGSGDIAALDSNHELSSFQVWPFGTSSNDWLMRICYSAADVVVLPTRADNLPSVLIESLSCGTPCVSYSVGGVGEIIEHMQTGYLARYRDVQDLAAGILLLLTDDQLYSRISEQSIKIAAERFDIRLQVRRYIDVFNEAIQDHRAKGG